MAPDYRNGKVYGVRCDTENDDIVYVGSTVRPLSERMAEHRKRSKSDPEGMLHISMADVGIEHFHIELITSFPCDSMDQLRAEEGRHIRLLHPRCNRRIECRTHQEWYEDNREIVKARDKARHEANKEAISERRKETYDPEKAAVRNKKWYAENREAAIAHVKEYADANKEKISARMKAYYEANKERIRQSQKEYKARKAAAAATTS